MNKIKVYYLCKSIALKVSHEIVVLTILLNIDLLLLHKVENGALQNCKWWEKTLRMGVLQMVFVVVKHKI